jgi:hypothetical protein
MKMRMGLVGLVLCGLAMGEEKEMPALPAPPPARVSKVNPGVFLFLAGGLQGISYIYAESITRPKPIDRYIRKGFSYGAVLSLTTGGIFMLRIDF